MKCYISLKYSLLKLKNKFSFKDIIKNNPRKGFEVNIRVKDSMNLKPCCYPREIAYRSH